MMAGSSKQSTNWTGALPPPFVQRKHMDNVSFGFNSGSNFNSKPEMAKQSSNKPGILSGYQPKAQNVKSFRPLRDQGRLNATNPKFGG